VIRPPWRRTNYTLAGTVSFMCDPNRSTDGAKANQVEVLIIDSVPHMGTLAITVNQSLAACGSPELIPDSCVVLSPTGRQLGATQNPSSGSSSNRSSSVRAGPKVGGPGQLSRSRAKPR
jgi:hypothetical protein